MRLTFTSAAEGCKRPKSVHVATLIHFINLLEGINSHYALDFDPDAPNTWPTDAESWYQVSYTTVTISNRQVPFPPEGYYAIFGSVFDRDPHNPFSL